MIIREFITKLGFDADSSKVKSFDRAVQGMAQGLAAAVAAMSAVSLLAGKLAGEAAKYGDEVAKTSRQIGIGSEALQEYRFAFDRLGVSEGEATSALERFSRALGRAAQGEKTEVEAFQRLGINIRDSAGELRRMEDLLPDVADAMAAAGSEAERTAMAQDIFGRSGGRLAAALAAGGAEISDLREEFRMLGGGLSDEQTIAAEGFTDALTNMRTVMQGLRLQIGARLMPVIQPMIEAFTMFMVQNREIIGARVEQAFVVIADAISNLMGIARGVMDVFGPIVSMLNDAGPAGWAAAAAFLAMFTPFGKIHGILIAGGLLVALEDIGAWMKGQPSLIGKLLGPYEDFAEAVANLVEQLGGLERVSQMVIGLLLARWAWGVMAAMAAAATSVGLLTASLSLLNKHPLVRLVTIGMHDPSAPSLRDMNLGTMPTGLDQRLGAEEGETFGAMLNRRIFGGGSGQIDVDPAGAISTPNDAMMRHLDQSFGVGNTVNMDFTQHITTPPGTTDEQLSVIRRESERAINREIDRAVKALED